MKYKATLIGAAMLLGSTAAHAVPITSVVGLNLDEGGSESSSIQVFSEQTGVSAGPSVTVDYLLGTNLSVGNSYTGVTNFSSGQALTAGTYNSFLVHYDPESAASISDVDIDFGQNIVALILSNSNGSSLLNVSDSIFGSLMGTTYEQHRGRRSEDNDTFTLTSATTLTINAFQTNASHVDNIRVLTDATSVPTPAALPLLLTGLGILGLTGRRKRKPA